MHKYCSYLAALLCLQIIGDKLYSSGTQSQELYDHNMPQKFILCLEQNYGPMKPVFFILTIHSKIQL